MSSEKDIIVINKMIKYCYDAIKYTKGVSYEEFVEDERSLVFSIFSLSQFIENLRDVLEDIK
ncbi:MAG: hypothetical protein FWF46_05245 [Oscillospiraceae bacterium]|nr:hypothetical protein [Oscillospiraceae bacterium]